MRFLPFSCLLQGYLRSFLLPAFLFLSGFAVAVNAVPTNKDYGSLPTISMAAISPSGNLFAYRNADGDKDLFVVFSRAEKKVISAAHLGELNPHQIYFIDENKIILVVSDRKGNGSTVILYDIFKKKFKHLLRPGSEGYSFGSVIAVSADKKYLFMPAFLYKNSKQSAVMKLDLDLESTKHPAIHHRDEKSVRKYFMDERGNIIAKEVHINDEQIHSLSVKDGDKWRDVYTRKIDVEYVNFAGLTPDRKALIVLDEDKDTGHISYYSMSLIDGKKTENDFGREDADVESVITDINGVVHGVQYSGFNPSYKFIDPSVDNKIKTIIQKFPEQSVWLRDWTPDWKNILVYVEGSSSSGIYYLFTKDQEIVRLASSRPSIQSQDVHPIATVKIKARDGLMIPTLLTIPNTKLDAMKNLPAVLLPHGGPAHYDHIGFDWMAQAFANKGYMVIQPQFRGSTGFGLSHRRAGEGEWGKKMQDDLTDSLQFLIGKGYVDPARVCIVGASYGGYASLAGGAFTPKLYKCIVSVNGVSDLERMLRRYSDNSWIDRYWKQSIAKGESTNELLESISPANFAKNFEAPVLLIHGLRDMTVPAYQSKLIYKKLKGEDKFVTYKELKHENHYLESGETRLEMLESMVGFVEKHLGK